MINTDILTELDFEKEIRFYIDEGQYFYAYDISVKAQEKYPNNTLLIVLGALALTNSGAVSRASNLLDSIQEQLETSDSKANKLIHLFNQCLTNSSNLNNTHVQHDPDTIHLFSDLAKTIQGFNLENSKSKDIKTLKVAAEVYYNIWEHSQETKHLELSKNLSLECFRIENSVYDGIRAAILSWISNETTIAKQLAESVLQQCKEQKTQFKEQDLCQYYLTLTLAQLFLAQQEQAIQSCNLAISYLKGKHAQIVNMRNILTLLAEHNFDYPEQLLDILKPPVIVIFAGQAIDPIDAEEAFFPKQIEHYVAHAISSKLDEINAEIGYCSAACGSDLLFIEAMLDRGAEINIILPFAEEDFLNSRIRYAGNKWERRFKNALKLASSVTWSTTDPYLNDDELFRYNNLLIEGGARLRAETLKTIPKLMVVMDYLAPALPGSAADFMDQWADITSLHMIDLDDIRETAELDIETTSPSVENSIENPEDNKNNPYLTTSTQTIKTKPRVIKSMLFADIVHYSKMKEEQLPAIFEFLGAIKKQIELQSKRIDLVESWGDALYVAMGSTREMADYAIALCAAIEEIDHLQFGLQVKPELRIGLHVGPVYEGIHPLTDRKIIFGQHVSRAARIEPITVPGEIYTSEHFVAVLKAEENAARHEAEATQTDFNVTYYPEYIGILELPKKFGKQAVYHLHLY